LGNKWSREQLRHLTLNSQGCDPDKFGCKYLKNRKIYIMSRKKTAPLCKML